MLRHALQPISTIHDIPVFSGFSINHIDRAKTFCGQTLGLDVPERGVIGAVLGVKF